MYINYVMLTIDPNNQTTSISELVVFFHKVIHSPTILPKLWFNTCTVHNKNENKLLIFTPTFGIRTILIVSVLVKLTSKAHVEVVASHPPDLILCCTEVGSGVMDILRTLNGELPIGQSIPRVPRGRDVILTSVIGNLGDLIVRLRIPVSYTFEGCCQGFADNHDAPGLN